MIYVGELGAVTAYAYGRPRTGEKLNLLSWNYGKAHVVAMVVASGHERRPTDWSEEGNPRQERRPGLGRAAEICGGSEMTSDARRCLVSTIVLLGVPFALSKRARCEPSRQARHCQV